jgi:DNA replication protein DnaC
VLSELPYSPNARFNPQSICLDSTRTAILAEIKEWINLTTSQNTLLLCGMAGTGKSTILNTIASYCNQRKELGGSFHFKRNDDARTAKYMFSTIARGIADLNKDYKLKLCEAIENDIRLCTSGQTSHHTCYDWLT